MELIRVTRKAFVMMIQKFKINKNVYLLPSYKQLNFIFYGGSKWQRDKFLYFFIP